jgi:hypothetical protein
MAMKQMWFIKASQDHAHLWQVPVHMWDASGQLTHQKCAND